MIIVTGGAGFIGSNIVQGLNARGITDILVVDDLHDRVVVIDRDAQANGASVRNFGFVTVTGQARGEVWRRARRVQPSSLARALFLWQEERQAFVASPSPHLRLPRGSRHPQVRQCMYL